MIKMNEVALKNIKGQLKNGYIDMSTLHEEDEIDLLENMVKIYENWNELKKKLERRINSYEERKKLGEGYELTEVMEISLACDKRFLKEMQELEQGKDENNK